MDSTGKNIRLTLTGASHAPEVGFTLEGIPRGTVIDMDALRTDIRRRSAAAHPHSTPRREADDFSIKSGISNGVADGFPICFGFPNRAHDSSAYSLVARPSHADYAAYTKYGGNVDIRGGGKYSGRMTLPLVAAGSICRGILSRRGIDIFGHVLRIGAVSDERFDAMLDKRPPMDKLFPLVDGSVKAVMERAMADARSRGDTLSCEAECAVTGLPTGLGEPLFDSVEGTLSKLLFMIPGLRGVEFGEDHILGSRTNDQFTDGGRTLTNHSGGVNGGMTNGQPLIFRCWFRPIPSIALPQTGFDLQKGVPAPLTISGRHDVCILPRGLVAVECAAAIGLLDLIME